MPAILPMRNELRGHRSVAWHVLVCALQICSAFLAFGAGVAIVILCSQWNSESDSLIWPQINESGSQQSFYIYICGVVVMFLSVTSLLCKCPINLLLALIKPDARRKLPGLNQSQSQLPTDVRAAPANSYPHTRRSTSKLESQRPEQQPPLNLFTKLPTAGERVMPNSFTSDSSKSSNTSSTSGSDFTLAKARSRNSSSSSSSSTSRSRNHVPNPAPKTKGAVADNDNNAVNQQRIDMVKAALLNLVMEDHKYSVDSDSSSSSSTSSSTTNFVEVAI